MPAAEMIQRRGRFIDRFKGIAFIQCLGHNSYSTLPQPSAANLDPVTVRHLRIRLIGRLRAIALCQVAELGQFRFITAGPVLLGEQKLIDPAITAPCQLIERS